MGKNEDEALVDFRKKYKSLLKNEDNLFCKLSIRKSSSRNNAQFQIKTDQKPYSLAHTYLVY